MKNFPARVELQKDNPLNMLIISGEKKAVIPVSFTTATVLARILDCKNISKGFAYSLLKDLLQLLGGILYYVLIKKSEEKYFAEVVIRTKDGDKSIIHHLESAILFAKYEVAPIYADKSLFE